MAIVIVEGDPTGTPRLMTRSATDPFGLTDLDKVVFIGVTPGISGPAPGQVLIDFDATAGLEFQLGLGGGLTSQNILWQYGARLGSGAGLMEHIRFDFNGGGLAPQLGYTGDAVRLGKGDTSTISLSNGARIGDAGLIDAMFIVTPFAAAPPYVLQVFAVSGSIIGPSSFKTPLVNPFAPYGIPVSFDGSVQYDPAAHVAGSVSIPTLLDAAARVSFDPTITGILTATNVQDAIDEITPILLQNTVFVAKNGNDGTADGTIRKPFLTVQAAMEYAWTTYVVPVGPQPSPPFTRPCVYVMPGTYDDGNLVLPPQICVQGCGFNHSRIAGNWSIDDRWSNYVPPSLPSPPSVLVPNDFRSSWINVGLFGDINIDFNPVFSNEGKLYALNCRFAGNVTIAEKRVNPVSNSLTITASELLGDLTLIGIPTLLENCITKGGTLYITQAIGAVFVDVDNIFESSGGSFGNIVITSLDPTMPAYDCTFCHSTQPGTTLTLDGAYSTVKADLDAVPLQSLVSLAGGAGLNQITRTNQLNWSDVTAGRPPTPYTGQQFFDTSLAPTGLPIWWDGTQWIDSTGTPV
jgi:hypothetical protein